MAHPRPAGRVPVGTTAGLGAGAGRPSPSPHSSAAGQEEPRRAQAGRPQARRHPSQVCHPGLGAASKELLPVSPRHLFLLSLLRP